MSLLKDLQAAKFDVELVDLYFWESLIVKGADGTFIEVTMHEPSAWFEQEYGVAHLVNAEAIYRRSSTAYLGSETVTRSGIIPQLIAFGAVR